MGKIFSERSLESYLEIDHSDSPGISAEEAAKVGSKLVVPGGTKLKAPTRLCGHCRTMIMLNPLRTRDRQRCWGCFKYLCDRCGLIHKLDGQCRDFSKKIEDLMRQAARSNPL